MIIIKKRESSSIKFCLNGTYIATLQIRRNPQSIEDDSLFTCVYNYSTLTINESVIDLENFDTQSVFDHINNISFIHEIVKDLQKSFMKMSYKEFYLLEFDKEILP